MKEWLKRTLSRYRVDVRWTQPWPAPGAIPDSGFYRPRFTPWRADAERELFALAEPFTLVSADRCYVLATLAAQAAKLGGEFWECGVYRGGTARLIAEVVRRHAPAHPPALRLFDTFEGMPEADPALDLHRRGDFADTSLEAVRARLSDWPFVAFHPGLIPESFHGLEGARVAFAHVDVDLHASVRDCCAFLYPRLVPGGFLVFDDYGFASCPGARRAVDEFFHELPERPLVLDSGQAVVFRGPHAELPDEAAPSGSGG